MKIPPPSGMRHDTLTRAFMKGPGEVTDMPAPPAAGHCDRRWHALRSG
jgi:hypothetical protein